MADAWSRCLAHDRESGEDARFVLRHHAIDQHMRGLQRRALEAANRAADYAYTVYSSFPLSEAGMERIFIPGTVIPWIRKPGPGDYFLIDLRALERFKLKDS